MTDCQFNAIMHLSDTEQMIIAYLHVFSATARRSAVTSLINRACVGSASGIVKSIVAMWTPASASNTSTLNVAFCAWAALRHELRSA